MIWHLNFPSFFKHLVTQDIMDFWENKGRLVRIEPVRKGRLGRPGAVGLFSNTHNDKIFNMNKETTPNLPQESENQPNEAGSVDFPIIEKEEIYYFDRTPDLEEGKIIHYMKGVSSREMRNKFLLLTNINGLHYEFSLSETGYGEGVYQLSFKTKEYEYATTDLSKTEINILFSHIYAFVKKISGKPEYNIKEIRISPADASYSVEEINECIDKILSSSKNEMTRDELINEYSGFRIFDYHRQLFEEDFLKEHYNSKSRAPGRSRLFKMMIKKYFPDWEVHTEYSIGSDFTLKKRF